MCVWMCIRRASVVKLLERFPNAAHFLLRKAGAASPAQNRISLPAQNSGESFKSCLMDWTSWDRPMCPDAHPVLCLNLDGKPHHNDRLARTLASSVCTRNRRLKPRGFEPPANFHHLSPGIRPGCLFSRTYRCFMHSHHRRLSAWHSAC